MKCWEGKWMKERDRSVDWNEKDWEWWKLIEKRVLREWCFNTWYEFARIHPSLPQLWSTSQSQCFKQHTGTPNHTFFIRNSTESTRREDGRDLVREALHKLTSSFTLFSFLTRFLPPSFFLSPCQKHIFLFLNRFQFSFPSILKNSIFDGFKKAKMRER